MKGIREAEVGGDVLDQRAGLLQLFGGKVHFQAGQKLVGRLVVEPVEQAAKVGGVQMVFCGDL